MRRRVEFKTEDGTVLRGQIHAPDGGRPARGVVMCHGFAGVKAHIDHYAAMFAEAGLAALLYDHRGFGASFGRVRQEVDPHQQLSDLRDAITFAAIQPEFDSEYGFGLWGSSFAGGLAMVVGANDPRVTCVVAQIPNVSGHRNSARLFTPEQLKQIHILAEKDRVARLSGAPPMMVPVFSDDAEQLCVFPNQFPPDIARSIEAGRWVNEVTLRSLEHFTEFEPAGSLPYLAPKPLLMIVAEHDRCTFTQIQLDVYHDAPGPKQLISFPGEHFAAYREYFEQTGPPARDWLVEQLGATA